MIIKMKLFLTVLIFTISNISLLYCQTDSIQQYKNVVYAEILGNAIIGGIFYEREISNKFVFNYDNLNFKIGGNFLGIPSVASAFNYSFGNVRQIEIGIGYLCFFNDFADNSKTHYPTFDIGYKFIGKNSIYKFYFMPLYNFFGINFSIYRF